MKCTSPISLYGVGTVPCGRCMGCRLNKTREWGARMIHEMENHDNSVFVTLTYNDDNCNGSLNKRDVQLFMKRLRKSIDVKIKYYIAGEYGDTTKRPHYHAVIFGLSVKDKEIINDSWGLGFIQCSNMNLLRAKYVASYVQKKLNGYKAKEEYQGKQEPFALMSKGIGSAYCERNADMLSDRLFFTINGKKHSLPRYYRKKLGEKISAERLETEMVLRNVKGEEERIKAGIDYIGAAEYVMEQRKRARDELLAKLDMKGDKRL